MKSRVRSLARLRIWEVECPLLDAVLALSFDAGELVNCCQSAGVEVPEHACLAPEHLAVLSAHRACHEPSPLAHLLERRLDFVHAPALDLLEAEGIAALAEGFLGRRAAEVEDLPGRLWALGTLAGDEHRSLRAHLRGVLAMGGLLALRKEREA